MKSVFSFILMAYSAISFSQSPNFQFQLSNPTYDIVNNQVTFEIQGMVNVAQTATTIMTMRLIVFQVDFTDPTIIMTNLDGTPASSFVLTPIEDGNGTSGATLFGVNSDMFHIAGELRHLFNTTAWQTIGHLTMTVNGEQFDKFCPIIVFDENPSTQLSFFPGSSGIVCSSPTGIQGIVDVIHFNWIQLFPDGSGAPFPNPVCINDQFTKPIAPNFTSADGDFYSDNACFGFVLTSPDGNCWRMTIDDAGVTTTTKINCP